jgi:hypothetical protein
MWEPQHLTTLWVSTVFYRDSFTFFLIDIVGGWSQIGSKRHSGHPYANCVSPGWLRWWRNWWNDDWQGKSKYSEKTCPSAALSTTKPTCCPDANQGRQGGKPATNRLSSFTLHFTCNHSVVTCMSDYRRVLDWWLDLLDSFTCSAWLQFTFYYYTYIH